VKVLVTGGAGLIGMAVRNRLAADGHVVTAVDVTSHSRHDQALALVHLEDAVRLEEMAVAHSIEAIVHCGAISGPMLAKGQPLAMVDVNVRATAALLDMARRHRMLRFVNCSSISVYGDVGPQVITEDTPLHPTSVYGATKVACDALVDAFATEFGLSGVGLRIARVYGPYRRGDCLIRTMIDDALAGRPSYIPCDPEMPYHYVHANDVTEAILAALVAPALPHRVYTVSGGKALTMPEVVDALCQVIPEAQVTLVPGKDPVSDRQADFDLGRIAVDLGWRPRLSLKDGIVAYRNAILAGRAAV
jgi:UDP-glucuronate 4-epimerase